MAYVSNLIHNKKTNYLNNFPGNETDSDELGKFTHATSEKFVCQCSTRKDRFKLNESADQLADKCVHMYLCSCSIACLSLALL